MKKIIGLISIVGLTACVSQSLEEHEAKSKKIVMEKMKTWKRSTASTRTLATRSAKNKSNKQVAVYRKNEKTKFIKAPKNNVFKVFSKNEKSEIKRLEKYINKEKVQLGLRKNSIFHLAVRNIYKKGNRVFVKMDQEVRRSVGQKTYSIPLVGGGVVVTLKGSLSGAKVVNPKLYSINSNLKNPPKSLQTMPKGFDLSTLSSRDIKNIILHMKKSIKREKIEEYFTSMAKRASEKLVVSSFLKLSEKEQEKQIKSFFKSLNRIGTQRVLINLAQKKRLRLVNHGNGWLMTAHRIFDLPIEFDIEFPKKNHLSFKVKNLRNLNHMMMFNGYHSPNYHEETGDIVSTIESGSSSASGSGEAKKAVEIFYQAARYFEDNFDWKGLKGTNNNTVLSVHTGLPIDNAFWSPSRVDFAIGTGQTLMEDIVSSPSVIGHEYAHAVIEYSSGLVYAGQSGALNEHFADIQGVSLEAKVKNSGRFDYTIGEDVMRSAAVIQKKIVNNLVLLTQGVPSSEINQFDLKTVGLRNLYMPNLSFSNQQATMKEVYDTYGTQCEPKNENDYCGVHGASGVPNRIASQIIARFGLENTKHLFFNTLVYRLGPNADFSEYMRQMYEECEELAEQTTFLEDTACDEIGSIFQASGVEYPGNSEPTPVPTPMPPSGGNPDPSPTTPSSPELTFGGWLHKTVTGNLVVVDRKYDVVILTNEEAYPGHLTDPADGEDKGYFKPLFDKKCGRVTGRISQTQNSNGIWFNYFLKTSNIRILPDSSCDGISATGLNL